LGQEEEILGTDLKPNDWKKYNLLSSIDTSAIAIFLIFFQKTGNIFVKSKSLIF